MIAFLRIFFWPIFWLVVWLFGRIMNPGVWGAVWRWFWADPLGNIFWILAAYTLWVFLKNQVRFWYATYQSKHLVALKVLLPRKEGKIEAEKRTEKDFREKIAVMEQLYRALWDVRDLTFWRLVHFWILRYITISFEMILEKGELAFYVITQPYLVSIVERQITSFYEDAEVTQEKAPEVWKAGKCLVGYNMKQKKAYHYPIRSYEQMQDDPLNNLANSLSKFREDETAAIQVVVRPTFSGKWGKKTEKFASVRFKGKKATWLDSIPLIGPILGTFGEILGGIAIGGKETSFAPGAKSGDAYIRMIQPLEELYKRMGEKAGGSFYHTTIRVLGVSDTWQHALDMTNNLQVAFNSFKDVHGNWFDNHRMFFDFFPLQWNAPVIRWLWKHRINGFFRHENLLTDKELAGLYHFPDIRYNPVPVIRWITYKVLPPPPNAPKEGIVLGINRHRATDTMIRFLPKDRVRHQYIVGQTGCGKSTFIAFLARQDIANGDGVCVVDPHGDLIEDILAHVPRERAKDVIVFNPADRERPMGLNMLEAKTDEEKDRASLDSMEIFLKLFGNEIFGPRIQHYFRNGCLTLMDDEEEGATLIDVPRLFVDDEFQRYKVAKCRNPVVRSFWEHEIAKTGAREKEEMIPYFSAKFGPFVTNTTMRNIIGQPKSGFNFREVMDSGKILLVNLSKGEVGDINSQLIGLIFVNKIKQAALSRANVHKEERRRFYLYVDEFQNFITDAFAAILSEARKYELALIMAHQYIGQLVGKTEAYEAANTKVRDAVFGNVGTICSFKIGAEDAEYMAKEMAPTLSEQDLIGIPNFQCYAKLSIDNKATRPFSLVMIYDETGHNEKMAQLIIEYSRMKYGRKKIFVDQEIEDRIGMH